MKKQIINCSFFSALMLLSFINISAQEVKKDTVKLLNEVITQLKSEFEDGTQENQ